MTPYVRDKPGIFPRALLIGKFSFLLQNLWNNGAMCLTANNNFRLFSQLTIRNCYTTSCHAGQHTLARRPEQQGLARANAGTNGAKQSRQPQPGRGLVGI